MTGEAARPWTHYEIDDRRFLAEPRVKEGDLVDGMLRLELTRPLPRQPDRRRRQRPEDRRLRRQPPAHQRAPRAAERLSMTEDASSLPALRSGGFTIVARRRAAALVDHSTPRPTHEDTHTAAQPADLFAEDVTRGYRLDVEDAKRPGRWLSLHERVVTTARAGGRVEAAAPDRDPAGRGLRQGLVDHRRARQGEGPVPARGDVRMGRLEPRRQAARPGDHQTPTPRRRRSSPTNPYRHSARHPLRGHARARCPGCASAAPTASARAPSTSRATPSRRPTIVAAARHPEHTFLALGSGAVAGGHPAPPVHRRRVAPADGDPLHARRAADRLRQLGRDHRPRRAHRPPLAYLDTNERHVAPPLGVAAARRVARQVRRRLRPERDAVGDSTRSSTSPHTSPARSSQPGPNVFVVNPDPDEEPTGSTPARARGPAQSGEYVCHDVDDLDLPYLPDPLSRRRLVLDVAGRPATRGCSRGKTRERAWYDRRPLRVRIEHGAGRRSTTRPTPADRVSCRRPRWSPCSLSSYIDRGDAGADRCLDDRAPASPRVAAAAARRARAALDAHAVAAADARARGREAARAAGDRRAGRRRAEHRRATLRRRDVRGAGRGDRQPRQEHRAAGRRGALEGAGRRLGQDGVHECDGRAHVGDLQLEATEDACRIGRDDAATDATEPPTHKLRHEFADTKHRRVSYHASQRPGSASTSRRRSPTTAR